MRRALALAARGIGKTLSNPRVGAVLVRGNRVVGEGWHRGFGRPHAEPEAVDGERGGTLYVTLEPCAHRAKTPACTEAIVRSRVRRVVAATHDPDRNVRGRGVEVLRRAGVRVEVGLLQDEARRLNAPYFTHRLRGRAHVTLKLAVSADGKIAVGAGASKWITSEPARRRARRWRTLSDGVVVGIGTVLADDPRLTGPEGSRRNPPRFVLDSRLRVPVSARVLGKPEEVYLVTTGKAPTSRVERFKKLGANVWTLGGREDGGVDLIEFLHRAGRANFIDLFFEGGRNVATSLAKVDAIDRLKLVIAPKLLGGSWGWLDDLGIDSVTSGPALTRPRVQRLGGEDIVVEWTSAGMERAVLNWEPR